MAALDLKQKSMIKRIVDGDENLKVFHGHINCKNIRNLLNEILINGRWTSKVIGIKGEVFIFFHNKLKENYTSRSKLVNPLFQSLSMMDVIGIESSFTLDEVKSAIWDGGSEKAPGPDGFTFKFLKKYWCTIMDDMRRFVRHFEDNGVLPRGCNTSFITLTAKIKDPLSLNDFLPTSLIGFLNKIITKVLATRMKFFIGGVTPKIHKTKKGKEKPQDKKATRRAWGMTQRVRADFRFAG